MTEILYIHVLESTSSSSVRNVMINHYSVIIQKSQFSLRNSWLERHCLFSYQSYPSKANSAYFALSVSDHNELTP